ELASKHGGNQESTEATGADFVEPQYGQAPSVRSFADPEQVRAAAALLREAERPVVLAGNGVIRSGAREALQRFVHDRNIPVVTSLNGMSSIAASDPLCF